MLSMSHFPRNVTGGHVTQDRDSLPTKIGINVFVQYYAYTLNAR
jgi:hypothetical protein